MLETEFQPIASLSTKSIFRWIKAFIKKIQLMCKRTRHNSTLANKVNLTTTGKIQIPSYWLIPKSSMDKEKQLFAALEK